MIPWKKTRFPVTDTVHGKSQARLSAGAAAELVTVTVTAPIASLKSLVCVLWRFAFKLGTRLDMCTPLQVRHSVDGALGITESILGGFANIVPCILFRFYAVSIIRLGTQIPDTTPHNTRKIKSVPFRTVPRNKNTEHRLPHDSEESINRPILPFSKNRFLPLTCRESTSEAIL